MVVSDWLGTESESIGSVVPGSVVKEPSDSVETEGSSVVSNCEILEGIDSVVPGMVVTDPFDSVDVSGATVVRDCPLLVETDSVEV